MSSGLSNHIVHPTPPHPRRARATSPAAQPWVSGMVSHVQEQPGVAVESDPCSALAKSKAGCQGGKGHPKPSWDLEPSISRSIGGRSGSWATQPAGDRELTVVPGVSRAGLCLLGNRPDLTLGHRPLAPAESKEQRPAPCTSGLSVPCL